MKANVYHSYGSPDDVLELRDIDSLVGNDKEVLVMEYQRVVVTRHGGSEVLQTMEDDLPEPRVGEARVKVLATGVSAYDVMLRQSDLLPRSPRVPFTSGADVVGVVDKLGEGVSTVEPGQTVAGSTFSLGAVGKLLPVSNQYHDIWALIGPFTRVPVEYRRSSPAILFGLIIEND